MSESTPTSPPSTPPAKSPYPGDREQLVLAISDVTHCFLPRAYLMESAVDSQGQITLRFPLYTVTIWRDHPGQPELLPLLREGTIRWLESEGKPKPECESSTEGFSRSPKFSSVASVAAVELTPADERETPPELPRESAMPTDGHFLFEDAAGRSFKIHAAHLLAFESLLVRDQPHVCRFHFAKTRVNVQGPNLEELWYAVWGRATRELHCSSREGNVHGIDSLSIEELGGSPRPFLLLNPPKWDVPTPQ